MLAVVVVVVVQNMDRVVWISRWREIMVFKKEKMGERGGRTKGKRKKNSVKGRENNNSLPSSS